MNLRCVITMCAIIAKKATTVDKLKAFGNSIVTWIKEPINVITVAMLMLALVSYILLKISEKSKEQKEEERKRLAAQQYEEASEYREQWLANQEEDK